MNPDDYDKLPDPMDPRQLEHEFARLLAEANTPGTPPDAVMAALWHLAEGQYHTYERLSAQHRQAIEEWLRRHWKPTPAFVERAGMVGGAEIRALHAGELRHLAGHLARQARDDGLYRGGRLRRRGARNHTPRPALHAV